MGDERPTVGNGKICYLEIPANNIEGSAAFYNKAFGWKIRNSNGGLSFDDGVGEVSGMWVLGRKPVTEAGIIISIMVDDAEATSKLVTDNGGKIVNSTKMDSGEVIVVITDPAGKCHDLVPVGACREVVISSTTERLYATRSPRL